MAPGRTRIPGRIDWLSHWGMAPLGTVKLVWSKNSKAQRVSSLHLPKDHFNPLSRSDTYSSSAEGVGSWLRAAPIYKKHSWVTGSLGAPAQNVLARSAALPDKRSTTSFGCLGGQRSA